MDTEGMMNTGWVKDDKYEIIAILRDAMRKKNTLEIHSSKEVFNSRIKKIDESHVYMVSAVSLNNEVARVVLKDVDGLIIFNVLIEQKMSSGTECYLKAVFPSVIQVIQRRCTPRMFINKEQNFKCSGRYRSGESYSFDIVNISSGGCALSAPYFNESFLTGGGYLKNARLLFGTLGEVRVDLFVLNEMKRVECNKHEDSGYQISCQFNWKSLKEKRLLENILMEITIKNKRKKDIFKDIYYQFPAGRVKR
ncbi:TPA: hypothetical protein N2N45_003870 [Klebsiella aerogenes]|nr:hypothetical protein [Klebsiella aerogenes]